MRSEIDLRQRSGGGGTSVEVVAGAGSVVVAGAGWTGAAEAGSLEELVPDGSVSIGGGGVTTGCSTGAATGAGTATTGGGVSAFGFAAGAARR